MRLANPWGLAALGLLLPLVAWYLLKARRPRRVVASTMVWLQVPRAMTAATPWQRFRPDLTFWLCAVAIVAGALALARPYAQVPARLGDHTIIVVDVSGSMTAVDDGVSRLDQARRRVTDLVDGLALDQQVSVIAAGPQAQVLLAGATTGDEVADALDRLPIQHGPADMSDAFTLAAALQRPGQVTITHLVTDTAPAPGSTGVVRDVVVQPVGAVADNLAVTRLQVVPQGSGTSEVFVALRNWSQEPIAARLSVTVNGDEVVGEAIDFDPRGTVDRILSISGNAGDVLQATVTPSDDTVDALALDDSAWGLLRSPSDVQVTVATAGNLFLTAALNAVDGVAVTEVDRVPDNLAGVDMLVVDRLDAPTDALVPMLLIAPTTWPDGIAASPAVELPSITFQDDHELVAAVDLSTVAIATATPMSGPDLVPVAGGPAGTLVGAGRANGAGVVALGFALTDSNLPLTAAWPTLVANTVGWLAGPPASVPAGAGTPVTVPVPPGFDTVAVSPPDGATINVSAAAPTLVTDRVGLWRLAPGEASPGAAAAGLDSDAADLPPAIVVNAPTSEGDLAQGPPEASAVATTDGQTGEVTLEPGREPLVRWVLPIVLALLLAEWLRTTLVGRRRSASRATGGDRPNARPGGHDDSSDQGRQAVGPRR